MENKKFNYEQAFCRNIGWFTLEEQASLRSKTVAIAGCGGVGGSHTLTLARLGIGGFKLADFDNFSIENFNRQTGARMSTLEKPKMDITVNDLREINPTAQISRFDKGINDANIDEFLEGVDLYVDSLDFFALEARRLVFAKCSAKSIPAITAAPLGMGTAFLCFMPGQMTFEEYFGMEGKSKIEQYLRFWLGLAPANMQAEYLVDPSRLDLKAQKGPSTSVGCTMSTGVATAYAVKILLNRGEIICAPEGMQWDPFLNEMKTTKLTGGHLDPSFQAKLKEAKLSFKL